MSVENESTLDLSIVIVCFNDRAVLMPCLESIFGSNSTISHEVIVVDNASSDGSADEARRRFPDAIVVDAGYNAGYTGGNNIGFHRSRGRWVLFLNPDTIIHDDALGVLVRRAEALEVGAIGPHTLNADGSLQRSVYRSPRLVNFVDSFLLNRLPLYLGCSASTATATPTTSAMEVDIVQGCCFASPRDLPSAWAASTRATCIYYEEADLQERIRRRATMSGTPPRPASRTSAARPRSSSRPGSASSASAAARASSPAPQPAPALLPPARPPRRLARPRGGGVASPSP
ncbi:MAG: glycosyltransferase [Planctomycetota bacterium]